MLRILPESEEGHIKAITWCSLKKYMVDLPTSLRTFEKLKLNILSRLSITIELFNDLTIFLNPPFNKEVNICFLSFNRLKICLRERNAHRNEFMTRPHIDE